MKFCDKLSKLRKENNLSQEQLADRMKMSRQSISKWELGSSIPDMATMISLCKILNCNIDDLLDDDIVGEMNVSKNSKGVNTYLNDSLKFITKTYNMFCSMKLKQKLKCILEMGLLLLIIYLILLILGSILGNLFGDLFSFINYNLCYAINEILKFIYALVAITTGLIVFIHIFKIRYLDYYVTIEDENVSTKNIEKLIEDKKSIAEDKKNEKIIIRDPKHSTYSFITAISKIIIFCVKLFVAFIMFMLTLSFISFVALTGYSTILLSKGIVFMGFLIIGLGLIGVNYIFLELMYRFIFNMKYFFKRYFIIFLSSILLVGVGGAVLFYHISNFNIVEYQNEEITFSETIKYKENLVINFLNESEIIYTDNDGEIKIEINHSNNFKYNLYEYNDYDSTYKNYQVYGYYRQIKVFDTYRLLIEGFSNKKLYDFDNENQLIKIYVSKNNYQKLQQNIKIY